LDAMLFLLSAFPPCCLSYRGSIIPSSASALLEM
jgi:hypothetical protein